MYKRFLWISHSAINAFDRCPQSYYYQYQYKNPETGNRIQIANPYFSLGLSVHQTIEDLSKVSVKERVEISLEDRFNEIWNEFSGKRGGFISETQENRFKKRGERMIKKVEKSDFLQKPSVDMKEEIPNIDLIPEEDIKLVGSLDWIQILPSGGLHIIDFKTGKNKEKNNSLQLPIYKILADDKLDDRVEKFSYWYLESENKPTPKEFDSVDHSLKKIKEKALEIKSHVESSRYPCHYNGRCFACGDFKRIFDGKADFLGTDSSGKDLYFIYKPEDIIKKVIDEKILDIREEKVFEMRMEGMKLDEIEKELKIPKKKLKKITDSIKKKLIEALSTKELKILIDEKLKK